MVIGHEKAQKHLGAVIRNNRKELGYSQKVFASYCGVHRTYMGAVERGERNISLMYIIQISDALKIKPSGLLSLAKP